METLIYRPLLYRPFESDRSTIGLQTIAYYYNYVYAIEQGVDSTNQRVEPVVLVLLHISTRRGFY